MPTVLSPRQQHLSYSNGEQSRERLLRDVRLPFTGRICLMVPFGGFSLMVPLQCSNISTTGLLASIEINRLEAILGDAIPDELLTEGDCYSLQLDHEFIQLPPVMLDCSMMRKKVKDGQWLVAFAFAVSTQDLHSLLHNIVRGAHESQTH